MNTPVVLWSALAAGDVGRTSSHVGLLNKGLVKSLHQSSRLAKTKLCFQQVPLQTVKGSRAGMVADNFSMDYRYALSPLEYISQAHRIPFVILLTCAIGVCTNCLPQQRAEPTHETVKVEWDKSGHQKDLPPLLKEARSAGMTPEAICFNATVCMPPKRGRLAHMLMSLNNIPPAGMQPINPEDVDYDDEAECNGDRNGEGDGDSDGMDDWLSKGWYPASEDIETSEQVEPRPINWPPRWLNNDVPDVAPQEVARSEQVFFRRTHTSQQEAHASEWLLRGGSDNPTSLSPQEKEQDEQAFYNPIQASMPPINAANWLLRETIDDVSDSASWEVEQSEQASSNLMPASRQQTDATDYSLKDRHDNADNLAPQQEQQSEQAYLQSMQASGQPMDSADGLLRESNYNAPKLAPQEREQSPQRIPRPTLTRFNAAVTECETSLQWERALLLIDEMYSTYVTPSVVTFSAGILACSKAQQWKQAVFLFQRMQQQKLTLDSISMNNCVSACKQVELDKVAAKVPNKGRKPRRALLLLDESRVLASIPESHGGHLKVIKRLLKLGEKKQARLMSMHYLDGLNQIHNADPYVDPYAAPYLSENNQPSDEPYDESYPQPVDVFNLRGAILAFAARRQWERVLRLFEEASSMQVMPTFTSFRTAISMPSFGGHWEGALRLLADMCKAGFTPDVTCAQAIIRHCDEGGQWQRSLLAFRDPTAGSGGRRGFPGVSSLTEVQPGKEEAARVQGDALWSKVEAIMKEFFAEFRKDAEATEVLQAVLSKQADSSKQSIKTLADVARYSSKWIKGTYLDSCEDMPPQIKTVLEEKIDKFCMRAVQDMFARLPQGEALHT